MVDTLEFILLCGTLRRAHRVVIYGRVSTEGQSADMQVAELTEYVFQRGWHLVGEYVDRGVSGTAPVKDG